MSTGNKTKINQLLGLQPSGVVLLSSWLVKQGYSLDLQKRYRKSHWLESIGTGAMVRTGEKVGYEGAIYALQKQGYSTIHPGGKTALSLLGRLQYLELSNTKVTLFGRSKDRLPVWFQKHDWGVGINYYSTDFLPQDSGMNDIDFQAFSIQISGPARAIMECLYLTPEKQELLECYEIMEGLNNLRPPLVQYLLEQCRSVKVKRLFMYMAEKAGHEWTRHLDLRKVDFGNGKRSLAEKGVYVPKYRMTVPRILEEYGKTI